jgi:hypothetical protein
MESGRNLASPRMPPFFSSKSDKTQQRNNMSLRNKELFRRAWGSPGCLDEVCCLGSGFVKASWGSPLLITNYNYKSQLVIIRMETELWGIPTVMYLYSEIFRIYEYHISKLFSQNSL